MHATSLFATKRLSFFADERIFTILRHQNLLKEFQEIAMQGTIWLGPGDVSTFTVEQAAQVCCLHS